MKEGRHEGCCLWSLERKGSEGKRAAGMPPRDITRAQLPLKAKGHVRLRGRSRRGGTKKLPAPFTQWAFFRAPFSKHSNGLFSPPQRGTVESKLYFSGFVGW